MDFKITEVKSTKKFKALLVGFLVVIGTFPENDWSFLTGIDSPLSWVFNYTFTHGLTLGKQIVFPHGPLAFFMYPLPDNIIFSTLLTSILKVILVFSLLNLVDYKGIAKWIISFAMAYLICVVSDFNHLILANLILFLVNFYNDEKWIFKLGAFILTAFAFYVKSYVAIISGILCFSFLAYYFILNRNFKKLGIDVLTILGLMFLLWIFMYGTTFGFTTYATGMFHLAQDNSTAVSYYPSNNWLILSFFLLILFSIPFVNNTKKSIFYGVLITLSLFAAWKHGMAREDISHVKGFLIYVIITLLIFVVFQKKRSIINLVFSILSIFLLSINMRQAINYAPIKYNLFGVSNFIEFVIDFSAIRARSQKETEANISGNKLPQAILDSIKSATVDIYPWDYSIIAANALNWQPRIVIQSYASYTSWLDNQNAKHFNSGKAPSFLVWELDKISKDVNGGDFNSIDERYLLNDEPQTMLQILKNYTAFYSNKKFMVFRKREKPCIISSSIVGHNATQWNEWNTVPTLSSSLLRLKLATTKSFSQQLKSFFYKDEQFWIYLRFADGTIHKYRIIPQNAKDGIWINPYIFNTNKHADLPVTSVMFRCSNQQIMNQHLSVDWEKIDFNNDSHYVSDFFCKTDEPNDKVYLNSMNTFETPECENWKKTPEDQLNKDTFFSGSKSLAVKANSFSTSFSYPLDSLLFSDLNIEADCWAKSKTYNYTSNISLVLSVDDASGNVIWKGIPVDGQLIDGNQWNNILNFINYANAKKGCMLNVYIWNLSNKEIFIDDFRVKISNNEYPISRHYLEP